jgi:hypothetical protein
MYQEGQLLKFSPFEFKNGNTPKPKYYVVLKHINEEVMMASLPTSKDHIPSDALVSDGCVDIPERQVNAFVFSPKTLITDSFHFELPTFIYGESVDEYEQQYLDAMNAEVEDLGLMEPSLFQQLKDCIKKASLLKRKFRKLL